LLNRAVCGFHGEDGHRAGKRTNERTNGQPEVPNLGA
jgi:hypothetical protein